MILCIDNYDSFSYNLFQLIGRVDPDVRVVRNDAMTVKEIEALSPEALVLSPGPGRPKDAGVCVEAVRYFAGKLPILGVCLGHQAICEAFGATITYAKELMHGKRRLVRQVTGEDVDRADAEQRTGLFDGLPMEFYAARYHSLAADEATLPRELLVTAVSEDGEVMAVEHRDYPIYGVQFHPESIMTEYGLEMVTNFYRNR